MSRLVEAVIDWLLIIFTFLSQTAMVAALVLLMLLLVIPEHSLIKQCVEWIKDLG